MAVFQRFFRPWCRIAMLVGIALAVLAGPGVASAGEPPQVVVSIKPIHSLVARLLDGIAQPTLIVDGSASPLEHELRPAQARALREADLVIWTGPELEPFLEKPVAALGPDIQVVELLSSDELKVLPARDDPDRRDPFLWLDSRNALMLVDELTRVLMGLDPERAGQYQENQARAVKVISAIDRELEYRYRDVSAAPIALYHDTQQYFEQAYAASIAAIVAPRFGAAPDTADLLSARASMQSGGVGCFFTEAGLDAPNLDLLTGGTGFTVATLDSLGTRLEPGPELYPQLMRAHFATIRDCIAPMADLADIKPGGHRDLPPEPKTPGELSGRFLLTDQYGRAVTNLDFLGKYQLIAFGYTSCPDVCPTSLALMTQAMNRLGDAAEQVQPIFITVDPERDTPEVLGRYAAFFHPRLLGLSGSKAMIDHTVKDFGARYEKVPSGDGDYAMNHTAGFYLFGPDGQFLEKLAHGLTAEQLTGKLQRYLQ